MLTIDTAQRRARLQRRHGLVPSHPRTVAEAAAAIVVVHATDPATVYLSLLARCPEATLDDISAALYEDRSLVKLIGMRRTMFVVPTDFAPVVHSAAGRAIAQRLRKQLLQHLGTHRVEPPIDDDLAAWLTDVEAGTERAVDARGEALASQLSQDEPRLRTTLIPNGDKAYDVPIKLTSRVLTLMGADGRVVRGRPAGTWLSRQHRWASVRSLWPDGMPDLPESSAEEELVRRWLGAFGPATVADLKWWTGWTLGTTRKVLARLEVTEVGLDDEQEPGVVLSDDLEPEPPVPPAAVLLPALDATPMGWQRRGWYLGPHQPALFDRNGNIGPTVWWDGRIVGGWAIRDGEIVWRLLEDVGAEASAAVAEVAGALQPKLAGASVIPSFRTPLERELVES